MPDTNSQTQNRKSTDSYTLLEFLTAKQQAKKHFHLGYTLLELLIVVSIMIIVFIVGFTSYRDYQRRQELETGVRQVRSDLSLVQTYAITGRKPDTPSGNACETSPLNGYSFTRIDLTSYRIEADCGAGVRVIIKDSIKLPSGIQLTSITGTPSSDSIVFHVLGRGVDRTSDTTISLRSIATNTTNTVIVTQSGEIK